MKRFNNFRRMLLPVAALAAAIGLTLGGCTKVDDTLGGNLIPDNQQMRAGYVQLPRADELNPKKYVETRLFQTDSIVSSNITYGYMGSMLNDTLGHRSAGFLSQMVNYYKVDSGYFGYMPIFDSAQILLKVTSFGRDSVTEQSFAVYEVVSNKYLTEKPIAPNKSQRDSTFYLNFDPVKAGAVGNEVLFTFTFPDGEKTGPATTYATMKPTQKGREFINRLMLQEGTYKGDYSIYSLDSLEQWVAEFKGLYIVPAVDQTSPNKGNIYATSLDASGFAIYGRNRLESDPTLIADTISIPYIFYDSSVDYGNVSVNTVERTNTRYIDYDAIVEKPGGGTVEPQQPFELGYVEGMGGALVELTLTDEFLSVLGELQAEQEDEGYRTVAINQALLSIYVDGVTDGGWEQGFSQKVIERFDASISRLGLYTDFKTLTPVSDYAYDYEQQYEVTLPYGGYLNRSLGCYTLNISSHIQRLWRAYQEAPIDPETGERQYTEAQKRMMTLYLAPGATDLFTFNRIALQGGIKAGENAPIHMELTYTLIK